MDPSPPSRFSGTQPSAVIGAAGVPHVGTPPLLKLGPSARLSLTTLNWPSLVDFAPVRPKLYETSQRQSLRNGRSPSRPATTRKVSTSCEKTRRPASMTRRLTAERLTPNGLYMLCDESVTPVPFRTSGVGARFWSERRLV
jgi:hypothetical protein